MTLFDAEPGVGGATLSDDLVHRFALWRQVGNDLELPHVTFVMLNPSTADHKEDDPTIRRCVGFAKAWGCSTLHVVNLFPYRTPEPSDLIDAAEAGVDIWQTERNEEAMRRAFERSTLMVCAWGANAARIKPDLNRRSLVDLNDGYPFWCFKLTKSGHPWHPLYMKAGTPLVQFDPRSVQL